MPTQESHAWRGRGYDLGPERVAHRAANHGWWSGSPSDCQSTGRRGLHAVTERRLDVTWFRQPRTIAQTALTRSWPSGDRAERPPVRGRSVSQPPDRFAPPQDVVSPPLRVCVVGSGSRFLSGISKYTTRLANVLADRHQVTVVTMRELLPRFLYPGRDRVGKDLSDLRLDPRVERFDGVDWYWFPSLLRGFWFLARHRPQVLLVQWWTGTVLHTYLALTLFARIMRMRVVIEFHEVLDNTGEMTNAGIRAYVGTLAPMVLRLASGFAVHSAYDEALVRKRYRVGRARPVAIVPLGVFDHYQAASGTGHAALRDAPSDVCNLLFFGVIRPYKGLDDLIRAFDSIPEHDIHRYWLTVVGETWEGWDLPATLIANSRYRDRITFVNRYVHDTELDAYLRGADAVVLPYRRSSISGPFHVAMAYGLPIIITDVGGNSEVAMEYGAAMLVQPGDADALRDGLLSLVKSTARHAHPRPWELTADRYDKLFGELGLTGRSVPAEPHQTSQ
jgi:glycosyltransferase involved in cell wall biosynthesis